MNKNILFLLMTISCLFGKIDAQVTTPLGLYISILGGPGFAEDDKNQPYFFCGVTGGYNLMNGIRFEEEITFQRKKYRNSFFTHDAGFVKCHGKIDALAFMTNILYEFDLGCKFKAYTGGGVGYAGSIIDHYSSCDNFDLFFTFRSKYHHKSYRNNFAWQLITGIKYEIIQNWDVGLDYRFTNNIIYSKSHGLGFSITRFF